MAAELAEHGELSEDWRPAVERVARHILVPRFFDDEDDNGNRRLIDGENPEHHERWLAATYDRNQSLVTEHDQDGFARSSATMPRIVLPMLRALNVQPGHRVLDIGTGSGYSTALLCERVGEANVTTIDAGAQVARAARENLLRAGYEPTIVTGDGFGGYWPSAPFDRIVSMVMVPRIPGEWVRQLRPGGVIVGTLPWTTVRLERNEDGSASGGVIAGYTFMWDRCHAPVRRSKADLLALRDEQGERTTLHAERLQEIWHGQQITAFWTMAQLIQWPYGDTARLGEGQTLLADLVDRSWALVELDNSQVTQGGPRRLWDEMEALYRELEDSGRPARDQVRLTVRPDGSQYLSLDSPISDHCWELRPISGLGSQSK